VRRPPSPGALRVVFEGPAFLPVGVSVGVEAEGASEPSLTGDSDQCGVDKVHWTLSKRPPCEVLAPAPDPLRIGSIGVAIRSLVAVASRNNAPTAIAVDLVDRTLFTVAPPQVLR